MLTDSQYLVNTAPVIIAELEVCFMTDMPKYVLKNKRLSKTKTVFIFRRNYLDIREFRKTEDGWLFEEEFTHYGNKCCFRMIVHSDDIFNMYDVNCKSAKVRGNKNSFGIFWRTAKQKANFSIKQVCEKVEFVLRCEGKNLAYDNGKGVKKTKDEKLFKQYTTRREGTRVAINVPNSVSWSAAHPFQGGGVSPR